MRTDDRVTQNSGEVMTPEEFRVAIAEIVARGNDDPERNHADIDDLLEKVLRQLGYGEGIDHYQHVTRWYA